MKIWVQLVKYGTFISTFWNCTFYRCQKWPHSVPFFFLPTHCQWKQSLVSRSCASQSLWSCVSCAYTAAQHHNLCVDAVTVVYSDRGSMRAEWQGSWVFAQRCNHDKDQWIMQLWGKVWTWKNKSNTFKMGQSDDFTLWEVVWIDSVILPVGGWQVPLTRSVTLWILNS